jgi:ferredoxin/coenzyme F420-reducing hydrogenase delta subunit
MMVAKPEGIDPKYLKLTYERREGPLSRRDLLFGPLTARYDVVPAVEGKECTAWKGCAQCLTACPQKAITIDGSVATIDKAGCVGCGACLFVCPVGAIRQPLLDPERLEARLKTLLLGREVAWEPKLLLLVADGGPLPEGTTGLCSLRLPSVGAVSAWLVLRAFTLGADGVAILACPSGCRHRCDPGRWEGTLWLSRELLVRFGIEPDRLVVVQREKTPSGLWLAALSGAIATLGPHSLRTQGSEALTLASLLRDLAPFAPAPPAPLVGPAVPFGMVRIEASRCTLCGACPERCPTGALELREDGESSRLLFDHARCVACEGCVRVCPEAAVEMERRLELSGFGSTAVLAEDQMAPCQRCGAALAPKSMLRKVQGSLNGTKAMKGHTLGRYCPGCRMLQSLGGPVAPEISR